jgi:RNA polymerase sigma-70 factor (ECF subfamily)
MSEELDDRDWLAARFEDHRGRLHAVAYRMLGSLPEAEDAVQESWLRLNRSGAEGVENLGAWLTTVVGRVCLNMLNARAARKDTPVGVHLPDPLIGDDLAHGPDEQAVLADSVGLALMVVLDTLSPGERLAFVLHDVFSVPFDEVAAILGRSPAATRQLASRARRRVRRARATPSAVDLAAQRSLVDAFFGAARRGDLEGLVSLLDPDVVVRADGGSRRREVTALLRGADEVARRALTLLNPAAEQHPITVNHAAGVLITLDGRPAAVVGFTISDGRILEINSLADPERLDRLHISVPRG